MGDTNHAGQCRSLARRGRGCTDTDASLPDRCGDSRRSRSRHEPPQSRSTLRGSHSLRIYSEPGTVELGYASPWSDFQWSVSTPHVRAIVTQLRAIAEPCLPREQFLVALRSAPEGTSLARHTSRSKSHFLATMARAITAMLRTKAETSNPNLLDDMFLPRILDRARRVLQKFSEGEAELVMCTLYDFVRNRYDEAALSILTDRVYEGSFRRWSRFSPTEKSDADNAVILQRRSAEGMPAH